MQIPSAYLEGYEKKARPHEQVLADLYIKHTTIGDPLMDPIMEEISSLPAYDLHAFVEAGIEQHDGVLRDAPQPLRDFHIASKSSNPRIFRSFCRFRYTMKVESATVCPTESKLRNRASCKRCPHPRPTRDAEVIRT